MPWAYQLVPDGGDVPIFCYSTPKSQTLTHDDTVNCCFQTHDGAHHPNIPHKKTNPKTSLLLMSIRFTEAPPTPICANPQISYYKGGRLGTKKDNKGYNGLAVNTLCPTAPLKLPAKEALSLCRDHSTMIPAMIPAMNLQHAGSMGAAHPMLLS